MVSISPVKRLILETMWLLDKPEKAATIAKETGVAFPSAMMHILGLVRMELVDIPQQGLYCINEEGRRSLGLPAINQEKASEILAYRPVDKSFHFYADWAKPLNIDATSLGDFVDKLAKLDISSIEFHVNRGDFEAWFNSLGDTELSRRILLIREEKLSGDEVRNKISDAVKNRLDALIRIRDSQPSSSHT